MASSRWPTTQFVSHEFVKSAGSVLFSRIPGHPLQVCFLHYTTKDEWLLPKGRQDLGESLSDAAVRETFEETGFACKLLPVTMMTRAPEPGVDMKDFPRLVRNCTEPFTVTVRHVSDRDVKFIWWFIAIISPGAKRRDDTQMPSENFESVLCDLSGDMSEESTLDAVVSRLTFEDDRTIVKNAIKLVYQTHPDWFDAK
ncbi:hypothetical protein SCHPADRAFT_40104 [Schizopora paradoxa]|uniref:Nudix hydrolase domain-containing protein n=1 Tax=Schizopora paradoxa TaxID=27342 RepID=A0A0H2S660_9AGAM|nr:hypothetical protein SCHPADRAFT_40104 [Schizopora paradoxa]